MVLDKPLLLKGLAGVAAIGGIAGGGIVYKNWNSGKAEKKPTDSPAQKIQISVEQEDQKGIPMGCEASKTCDITEDSIKKIKFQALGDGEEEVTVTPQSGINVTLTIEGDGDYKRYIFENKGSSEITLQRGNSEDKKVILKANGKTRFTVENNKFKKLDVGNYGLPARCTNSCTLIQDDLEQIKFEGFTSDGDSTVTGLNKNQTISLTIKNGNKYIFNVSEGEITIQRDNVSVTLDAGVDSEFTVNDKKLKKITEDELGLPKRCGFNGNLENQKTCEINEVELKKIKFKNIGENPIVTGFPTNPSTITLRAEKVTGRSYLNDRKYSFSGLTSEIKIKKNNNSDDNAITLLANVNNDFKETQDKHLETIEKTEVEKTNEKLGGLGIPNICNFEGSSITTPKTCTITKENLGKINFSSGNSRASTGTVGLGEGISWTDLTLEIKKLNGSEKTKYGMNEGSFLFTFSQIQNKITISAGSKNIVLIENQNHEFKISQENSGLEKFWNSKTIGEKVGLSCGEENADTRESDCTVPTASGGLRFKDNGTKYTDLIQDSSDSSSSNKLKVASNNKDYNLGFRVSVDSGDGDESVNISLKRSSDEKTKITLSNSDDLEIKYEEDGWFLTKKTPSR